MFKNITTLTELHEKLNNFGLSKRYQNQLLELLKKVQQDPGHFSWMTEMNTESFSPDNSVLSPLQGGLSNNASSTGFSR